MDIIKSFDNAFIRFKNNNLKYIYILIDIHGTVFPPPLNGNYENFIFYPYAKEVLKFFSDYQYFKIILWTGTIYKRINKIINLFNENNIKIDFINENIDFIKNDKSNYLNLPQKLYFDIGIDDRCGFNPEIDWKLIYEYLINKGGS